MTLAAEVKSTGASCGCVSAAEELLMHTGAFIALIDDSAYAHPCAAAGGTIGKHVRHVLDHFAAVLAGDGGVIDYDHRERGGPIEVSRSAAIEAIRLLRERLLELRPEEMDAPATVRVMVSRDGRTVDLATTIGRELAFATHHALHHHAMMRFIAAGFGVEAPEEFGMAPATVWGSHSGQRAANSEQ